MKISYLMQTIIAFLAFAILSSVRLHRVYRSKKQLAQGHADAAESPDQPVEAKSKVRTHDKDQGHIEICLNALSEFHKAQCLYSIALQIASFVALYGKNSAYKDSFDEAYLLLLSADGLIPTSITFYTLMLFRYVNDYHIVLTSISALLASVTGFNLLLQNFFAMTLSGAIGLIAVANYLLK